ncbi:MAG TPA: hypothetical protein VEW03_03850 [Longimicrobiaceae bacterium]|nr:hypothetical protein [Longimicrobiaceae bacterium]
MGCRGAAARLAVLVGGVLAVAACGDPRPAVVQGDAFLAHDIGREVELPGLRVRLVREPAAAAELDSALARACAAATDSAAAGAWRERSRVLAAHTVGSATANAAAQFVLDSVAPGAYRLWADTTVGDTRWTWLQPVTVRAGDTVRVNLTNSNPDENPFRCRRDG